MPRDGQARSLKRKRVDPHDPYRFRKQRARPGAAMAFIEHALTLETDDCILSTFGLGVDGYARLRVGDRHVYGHAYVCERAHGKRPPGMVAAHSCRRPACVNKRHLRWATNSENAADRILHGTSGGRKLKPDAVRSIKALAKVMRYRDVARMFGVSGGTVAAIVGGRTWACLPAASGSADERAA